MKQKYINSIKHKIFDYVVTNYKRIETSEFVLGDLPMNYKCFHNTVQKVKEGKANKVYACVTIDENNWKDIIIHFVNRLDDGKYQDNTLGYLFDKYKYYVIREIRECEYKTIEDVFTSIQESLVKANSFKFIRKILGISIEII